MSTSAAAPLRVDAHLHVWDLTDGGYRWLTPEHGELYASFSPESADAELRRAGVDAAVLVQADDTLTDTETMLALAREHAWVVGVVGWVDLTRPDLVPEQLDRWQAHESFCGVRHLFHADPRADLLDRPEVRRSLTVLAERGVPLDVPDAWPRLLRQVRDVAASTPGLRLVLDHLGKPPAGTEDQAVWRRAVAEIAALPGTVAKVSGLQHLHQGGVGPEAERRVRPVWETALELFGPDRLMYGGDWPMTVPTGGYGPALTLLERLVGELGGSEQEQLMGGTAVTTYGLSARRRRRVTDS